MGKDVIIIFAQLTALLIGIIGAIYQIRNFSITFRSSIKTDLEILKMLNSTDPNYFLIQNRIDESIKKIYSPRKNLFIIYKPTDFIIGIIFFFGFGFLTIYLSRENFNVWSLVTVNFVVTGFFTIWSSLKPKMKI